MAIEPVAGMLLGELELLELAGAGGFSLVWRARHAPTGELRAVKLPRVERFVEHLRREAALTEQVSDPRVVPILETHLDHDPPHVVMPWIEGAPLPLPDGVPPIEDGAVAFERLAALAKLVAAVHRSGVVHGDLKPQNVLVDGEGELHLLDLGLGRLQLETSLQRSLAQSLVSVAGDDIAGTLDYLAPELAEGAPASPASDCYALGIMLHQLLTGTTPSFGVRPSDLNPYLPPGTDALLFRLLRGDPSARLADAAELAASLRRLAAAERACLARPHGHARRRVHQHRLAVLRHGARALGVVAATVASVAFALTVAGALIGQQLASGVAVFATLLIFPALLMAVTTINAWVVGVPERIYKQRKGHPIWSFMMQ